MRDESDPLNKDKRGANHHHHHLHCPTIPKVVTNRHLHLIHQELPEDLTNHPHLRKIQPTDPRVELMVMMEMVVAGMELNHLDLQDRQLDHRCLEVLPKVLIQI